MGWPVAVQAKGSAIWDRAQIKSPPKARYGSRPYVSMLRALTLRSRACARPVFPAESCRAGRLVGVYPAECASVCPHAAVRVAEYLPCHYCLQSPLSRVILAPMPLPPLSTQLVATTQRVQDSCDIACMHIVPTVRSQDTSFRHPPASRPAPRASHLALVASRRAVPRGTRLRRAVPHIAPHLHAVEQSHTASRCAAPRAPPHLHRPRAAWSHAPRRVQSAVAAAPR